VANEYADWRELKEMRSIPANKTAEDVALQRAVTRASRAIDRKCGRRFWRDGVPSLKRLSHFGRVVSDGYSQILLVDDIADESSVSVTIAGEPATSISFSPREQGEPITGIVGASWYGGAIGVTADWGWPAIPESITEATLLLANRRYMRKDSPQGTSGWSAEGPVGVSRFDSDIEDLVEPFVLVGFGA
jgi:hypothetical protein